MRDAHTPRVSAYAPAAHTAARAANRSTSLGTQIHSCPQGIRETRTKTMHDLSILELAKLCAFLIPFALLCLACSRANLPRRYRGRQLLMPILALLLSIFAIYKIQQWCAELYSYLDDMLYVMDTAKQAGNVVIGIAEETGIADVAEKTWANVQEHGVIQAAGDLAKDTGIADAAESLWNQAKDSGVVQAASDLAKETGITDAAEGLWNQAKDSGVIQAAADLAKDTGIADAAQGFVANAQEKGLVQATGDALGSVASQIGLQNARVFDNPVANFLCDVFLWMRRFVGESFSLPLFFSYLVNFVCVLAFLILKSILLPILHLVWSNEKVMALTASKFYEKREIPEDEIYKSKSAKDTSDIEPAKDTSDNDSTKDTSDNEPAKDTSEIEPAKDTSDNEPTKDTSEIEPAKDTGEIEATKDTSGNDSTKDTSDIEATKDTSEIEPAKDTGESKPEPKMVTVWCVKSKAASWHRPLFWSYIVLFVGTILLLLASIFYPDWSLCRATFYPVFVLLVLGEVVSFLGGLKYEEPKKEPK